MATARQERVNRWAQFAKGESIMRNARLGLAAGAITACASGAAAVLWAGGGTPHLDADKIGQAAGAKATTTKDGVVRLAWSRTDVKVTVDGMALAPAAGLGSWAGFTPAKHGAMV